MKSKSLIIVCGDPKSIFNEILIKTFKNKIFKGVKFSIVIIGSKKLFKKELKRLKTKINLKNFYNQINLVKNSIIDKVKKSLSMK